MTVVMSVCIISSVPGTVWNRQGVAVTSTGDPCLTALTPHPTLSTPRSGEVEHQSQARASVGFCTEWWTVGGRGRDGEGGARGLGRTGLGGSEYHA